MSLTNLEKKALLYEATCAVFRDLDTLTAWLNYLTNITKAIIQADIAAKLDAIAADLDSSAADYTVKADDVEALADQVEAT